MNAITPVNAPVIDPTIGQVNFPRRISVADRTAAATVGAKALCHSVQAIPCQAHAFRGGEIEVLERYIDTSATLLTVFVAAR